VALRFREPSFGHILNGNPVYFNHDLDYLHFSHSYSITLFFYQAAVGPNAGTEDVEMVKQTVQNVILGTAEYQLPPWSPSLAPLYKLSSLKTLAIWDGMFGSTPNALDICKILMESYFKEARGEGSELPNTVPLNLKDFQKMVL
jgi:hypothetical protein